MSLGLFKVKQKLLEGAIDETNIVEQQQEAVYNLYRKNYPVGLWKYAQRLEILVDLFNSLPQELEQAKPSNTEYAFNQAMSALADSIEKLRSVVNMVKK